MTTAKFHDVLVQSQGKLYAAAYALTINRDDANDLLQETYLKALTYEDKFTQDVNLVGWLYTILKNTWLNNKKRKSIKSEVKNEKTYNEATRTLHTSHDSPMTYILGQEIGSKIDALENNYRRPFKLFIEGFKYKEIAEELQIPIGTVKSLIHLARKKLLKKIEN